MSQKQCNHLTQTVLQNLLTFRNQLSVALRWGATDDFAWVIDGHTRMFFAMSHNQSFEDRPSYVVWTGLDLFEQLDTPDEMVAQDWRYDTMTDSYEIEYNMFGQAQTILIDPERVAAQLSL